MLLFFPAVAGAALPEASPGQAVPLHLTLAEASLAASALGPGARVLVLRPDRLQFRLEPHPSALSVPPEAVLNGGEDGTYWPPRPVEAAGGYVVRRGAGGGLDVLLIHRRGVWDLPKGKLEQGEAPPEGALREVSEEVGVTLEKLRLLSDLGPTVHGYLWPKKGAYAVKTTHWYAMATSAEAFTPQAEESIKEVRWMPWPEARRRLGFASLRSHLARLDVRALDPEGPGIAA